MGSGNSDWELCLGIRSENGIWEWDLGIVSNNGAVLRVSTYQYITSLVYKTRSSPSVLEYCKLSSNGGREGLGTKPQFSSRLCVLTCCVHYKGTVVSPVYPKQGPAAYPSHKKEKVS